jgi:hypothetical protein
VLRGLDAGFHRNRAPDKRTRLRNVIVLVARVIAPKLLLPEPEGKRGRIPRPLALTERRLRAFSEERWKHDKEAGQTTCCPGSPPPSGNFPSDAAGYHPSSPLDYS